MIRFYNCKIIDFDGDVQVKEGLELWTKGEKIEYIGEHKKGDFEREIDCGGNVIMPGFKNAHAHSPMTFLRSYAEDLPLDRWLNEAVFPMESKLNDDYGVWFTKLAIMEYLTSGITSAFDMYFLPEAIYRAVKETGYRSVICGAVNNFVSNPKELEEEHIKYNKCGNGISHMLGFHAEYTTDIKILEEIAEISNSLKAPVSAHCSETLKEVNDCIKRYGKSPIELFESIGLLNYGGCLFHCNYLSERDIEIMKEKNIYAVTNPASNCKLASGIAPVTKLIEKGVKAAIGTDGSASNNALDMFREMYLVSALQKVSRGDAAAMPAERVIEMACVNGALAMGIDSDCLKEGKNADIIMIDLKKPNMQPENNILKNIVYSGSKENVALTMVRGRILYERGKFNIGVDENEVYEKCNTIVEELKKM